MPHEIRQARLGLGWTQAQAARMLGVHEITVSKWERGRASPTAYPAALWAVFRGVDKLIGKEAVKILNHNGVNAALYFMLAEVYSEK